MTTTEQIAEPIEGYRRHMSEQEFADWVLRERVRAEWVEGEVLLMSPVSVDHADLVAWLVTLMRLHADTHRLGRVIGSEVMNRLKGRRRVPDIFFVAAGRETIFRKTFIEGPADLLVEVVSPESVSRDWRDKFLEYEANGVREYWVIDPNSRHAEFYELASGKYRVMEVTEDVFRSAALRGFWMKVGWMWQVPLPSVQETAKIMGLFNS